LTEGCLPQKIGVTKMGPKQKKRKQNEKVFLLESKPKEGKKNTLGKNQGNEWRFLKRELGRRGRKHQGGEKKNKKATGKRDNRPRGGGEKPVILGEKQTRGFREMPIGKQTKGGPSPQKRGTMEYTKPGKKKAMGESIMVQGPKKGKTE